MSDLVLPTGKIWTPPRKVELPCTLREYNPMGAARFEARTCRTCNGPIMGHWLRHSDIAELKGVYWCEKEGGIFSEGMVE